MNPDNKSLSDIIFNLEKWLQSLNIGIALFHPYSPFDIKEDMLSVGYLKKGKSWNLYIADCVKSDIFSSFPINTQYAALKLIPGLLLAMKAECDSLSVVLEEKIEYLKSIAEAISRKE